MFKKLFLMICFYSMAPMSIKLLPQRVIGFIKCNYESLRKYDEMVHECNALMPQNKSWGDLNLLVSNGVEPYPYNPSYLPKIIQDIPQLALNGFNIELKGEAMRVSSEDFDRLERIVRFFDDKLTSYQANKAKLAIALISNGNLADLAVLFSSIVRNHMIKICALYYLCYVVNYNNVLNDFDINI